MSRFWKGIVLGLTLPWFAAAAEFDFNLEIRPILSNKCFHCHGFDAKERKAKLRLDTFEGATRDLGGYAAIVPGKPEQSELLKRVEHHDPEERMPPEESGRTLQPAEIAKLRQWISEGAAYRKHWAWVAPTPRSVPSGHEKNPIDGFVLQLKSKLQQLNQLFQREINLPSIKELIFQVFV